MKTNNHDLLAWGASLHYPCVVLDRERRIVLRPNEQAWRALLSGNDSELIARLQARRERWLELSKETS